MHPSSHPYPLSTYARSPETASFVNNRRIRSLVITALYTDPDDNWNNRKSEEEKPREEKRTEEGPRDTRLMHFYGASLIIRVHFSPDRHISPQYKNKVSIQSKLIYLI